MSYQKCPICKGKKKKVDCRVCLGEGIINEQSGKPPSQHYYFTYPIYPVYPTPNDPTWITYVGDDTNITSISN